VKLPGNRIRKSSGKVLHFKSKRKRDNWERVAQAYKHGWRPKHFSAVARIRGILERLR